MPARLSRVSVMSRLGASALSICKDDVATHLQGPICPADDVATVWPRQVPTLGPATPTANNTTAEQYVSI